MKNLYNQIRDAKRLLILSLSLIASILLFDYSYAQKFTGDLTLSFQAQIDTFNYEEVTGELIIREQNPGSIKNLLGLSELRSVGSNLFIQDNSSLQNIDGLSNLTCIGGNLFISFNLSLVNINGLTNLKSVGKSLIISTNNSLIDIDALSNLTTIRGDLDIENNPALTTIYGLSNITTVGGYLDIQNNDALHTIDELSKLSCVKGAISIFDNDNLENIDGLSNITNAKDVFIQDNEVLTRISGLSGLTSAAGNLSIVNNDALRNLNGLSKLISTGTVLAITDNDALSNIDSLSNFTSAGEFLFIINNNSLTNIDGLLNLSDVLNIHIRNNPALTQFCGIYKLISSGGMTGIYNISNNGANPSQQEIINSGPCTTNSFKLSYMTIQAVSGSSEQALPKLTYYSLAEGNQFYNIEGEIAGIIGKKNIDDLTIDDEGNYYLLNNSWTSFIYRIHHSEIDLNHDTPVRAVESGMTRMSGTETLVQLSKIQFINGKLYGMEKASGTLYEINTGNGLLKKIKVLNNYDAKLCGLSRAADGNVYLVKNINEYLTQIWKYEDFPAGDPELVCEANTLNNLQSITAHPNGNLYAADKENLYEINLSAMTIGVLENYKVDIKGMTFNFSEEEKTEAAATLKFNLLTRVTSLEHSSSLPSEYNLMQNYPNPFNPATIISYQLSQDGVVTLKIYDALGVELKTLINENKSKGRYDLSYNAGNLPSGVYYYKLTVNDFSDVKKLLLIK